MNREETKLSLLNDMDFTEDNKNVYTHEFDSFAKCYLQDSIFAPQIMQQITIPLIPTQMQTEEVQEQE